MVLQLINFAGSLCFLLYGMKLMSDGIQKGTGQKLQKAFVYTYTVNADGSIKLTLTNPKPIDAKQSTTLQFVGN